MTSKFIAMVPARAGSQGLPDKNVRPLAGKPLMAHSIRPALECSMIGETFINSDSDSYLEIGKAAGAMTYRRPDHLGQSDTTMQAVVAEFIEARRRARAMNSMPWLCSIRPIRSGRRSFWKTCCATI